jgi:ATP-binding cassette, subfamily C, bacterial CydD
MRPFDPRLLQHARAARSLLIITVCLGLITTAFVLAQASLLAHALAGAARGADLAALRDTVLLLLLVLTGRAAAAFGSEAAALRAAASVKSELRRRLTEHALRLGPAWLSGQQVGEITTLSTKGLDALDPYFARYLPQLVLGCLVPIAVLIRVTAADWISGLVIVVTLPLIPIFAVLVGLHAKAHTQRQWSALASLGGHFLDVVEGLPTLKLFGRAKAQAELIRRVTGEHRTATMAALRIAFLSALVLELAAALATALVAVEVGLRLLGGHIGYETALMVLLLTPEAYLPLRSIGGQFHASVEGATAAGRVFEILDSPLSESRRRPTTAGPHPAWQADLSRQAIELRAVTLTYPGRNDPALREVSATISPGQRIVLTGPSGAGKSSLLGLLLRFTEPTAGRIEVGGTDLDDIPVGHWRRQIAWVPQSPYLFAGTVAQNIALGEPSASADAIRKAAKLAGAEEFIMALASGFDTELGERALSLSAGQRERIALARAFLRDAPLVLLDEPTSHLDPVTASELLADIDVLMAGRTVLLISHGHHVQIRADQVLRLDNGELAPPAAAPDAPDPVPAAPGPVPAATVPTVPTRAAAQ